MSLQNFRTYQLAVEFYRLADRLRCAAHLKSQLLRAASSVPLNLAEGSEKPHTADKKRYYVTAFASLRECQAILDLVPDAPKLAIDTASSLGACLYRLIHPK